MTSAIANNQVPPASCAIAKNDDTGLAAAKGIGAQDILSLFEASFDVGWLLKKPERGSILGEKLETLPLGRLGDPEQ